jgi:hypothetical protein
MRRALRTQVPAALLALGCASTLLAATAEQSQAALIINTLNGPQSLLTYDFSCQLLNNRYTLVAQSNYLPVAATVPTTNNPAGNTIPIGTFSDMGPFNALERCNAVAARFTQANAPGQNFALSFETVSVPGALVEMPDGGMVLTGSQESVICAVPLLSSNPVTVPMPSTAPSAGGCDPSGGSLILATLNQATVNNPTAQLSAVSRVFDRLGMIAAAPTLIQPVLNNPFGNLVEF